MSARISPAPQVDEDDWEYEYDQDEKEVFLVDIDLTTTNRVIKAASATRAKRLLNPATPRPKPVAQGRKRRALNPTNGEDGQVPDGQQQPDETPRREAQVDGEDMDVDVEPGASEDNIQILDLHSGNPLVSYHGYLYSCSWVDLVGTNMFFTEHQESPLFDPELATDDYDLVGTSRIKLVGQQATLKPKPVAVLDEAVSSGRKVEPAGKSLGTIRRNNAHLNIALRKQANFLEQLMNIKRNRGESDSVRLVVNSKTVKAAEGGMKFDSTKQRDEIEELNARVVKGDQEAYDKLEDMYCGRDTDESDEEAVVVEADSVERSVTAIPQTPPKSHPATRSVSFAIPEVDTPNDDGDDDDNNNTNAENG